MRQALADAHVPQPRFVLLPPGADVPAAVRKTRLPCVVKPLSLSGSRGVIRADDPDRARAAAERVRAILATAGEPADAPLLLESYLPGAEVAVEGLLCSGRHAAAGGRPLPGLRVRPRDSPRRRSSALCARPMPTCGSESSRAQGPRARRRASANVGGACASCWRSAHACGVLRRRDTAATTTAFSLGWQRWTRSPPNSPRAGCRPASTKPAADVFRRSSQLPSRRWTA